LDITKIQYPVIIICNTTNHLGFVTSYFSFVQVESIKKIAEYVSQLRLVGKGHGMHILSSASRVNFYLFLVHKQTSMQLLCITLITLCLPLSRINAFVVDVAAACRCLAL